MAGTGRHAGYGFSGDPITEGHLWVIARAAEIADRVTVMIARNPKKAGRFSWRQRVLMAREAVEGLGCADRIAVRLLTERRYLVRIARDLGAQFLVRGIRSTADFPYEADLRAANEELAPEVTTLFLMPPDGLARVSSSLVMEMAGADANWEAAVARKVPACVLEAVRHRLDAEAGLPRVVAVAREPEDPARTVLAALRHLAQDGPLPEGDGSRNWAVQGAFRAIAAAHAGRPYHGLGHVAAVVRAVAAVEAGDLRTLLAAALVHDLEMFREDGGDEAASADRAPEVLEGLLHPHELERVRRNVLATRPDPGDLADDPEAWAFRMCDRAVLARPPAEYAAYAGAVRAEWAHVGEAAWRTGRAAFLAGLLAGGAPVLDDAVLGAGADARAKANAAAELAALGG